MASNKYLFMECLHSFWGSILNFNGIMITFNNKIILDRSLLIEIIKNVFGMIEYMNIILLQM